MKTFNRKTLYFILGIIFISLISLTVVYASLSVVLNISGSSEITASSWNIHLDNVKVKSGSVAANAPVISGNSTLAFEVELNTPGEFYEFTVDVVNEGSIDAMIDSVVKTPELTTEQAKYIKYEVTYENGESISTNQILKKGTATPIKVRLEYRKDIVASDLPSSATELSLKLTLVYVQSDGTGSEIKDNGEFKLINVVSGNGTQVGNEVCIKNECFYVMYSDDTTVTMLAKYNLDVGNICTSENVCTPLASPTGLQNSTATGSSFDIDNNAINFPWIGINEFSDSKYWTSKSSLKSEYGEYYPAYVYDSNSTIYLSIENYKLYLQALGLVMVDARVITYEELEALGCSASDNSCTSAPDWIYSTSYWTGSADTAIYVWGVFDDGLFIIDEYQHLNCGVRPVIVLDRSAIDGAFDGTTNHVIEFTIDGSVYQANEGMTWEEWVASDYNTIGCTIKFNSVRKKQESLLRIYLNGAEVPATDLIVSGTSYIFDVEPT